MDCSATAGNARYRIIHECLPTCSCHLTAFQILDLQTKLAQLTNGPASRQSAQKDLEVREQERQERERQEKEKIQRARDLERREQENLKRAREQQEQQRLERERLEQARAEEEEEKQARLEKERLEQARLEQERLEIERVEQERRQATITRDRAERRQSNQRDERKAGLLEGQQVTDELHAQHRGGRGDGREEGDKTTHTQSKPQKPIEKQRLTGGPGLDTGSLLDDLFDDDDLFSSSSSTTQPQPQPSSQPSPPPSSSSTATSSPFPAASSPSQPCSDPPGLLSDPWLNSLTYIPSSSIN